MLRTWLVCPAAIMSFALVCFAGDRRGATPEETRLAMQWASEEPGYSAKRHLPGVDYPAVVRKCLAREQKSFRYLFALSAHTDAAASDLQSGILAIVLKQVGDNFFTAELARAPNPDRVASLDLLRYALLDDTATPFNMRMSDYPKLARLLQRPNPYEECQDVIDG